MRHPPFARQPWRQGRRAGDARKAIEADTGTPVITAKNSIDFTHVIELVGEATDEKDKPGGEDE